MAEEKSFRISAALSEWIVPIGKQLPPRCDIACGCEIFAFLLVIMGSMDGLIYSVSFKLSIWIKTLNRRDSGFLQEPYPRVVIALSFSAALFSNFNINQSNIQVKDFGRMMKPLCVRYGSGKGERKLQCGIVRICLSLESFHITHFPSTSLTLFNLIG
uniref:AlNc14C147G7432 protein n=1 Tax=Albugo laibachii Nc14 TaxID=890382 RepID=F0WLP6_9STRA|nr:AlNc14C147G7432 [Albugo laibachii Nc14]|eukprot:CCA22212.1 AlNc14C147G7432 [Albugo laibachii Nc14]